MSDAAGSLYRRILVSLENSSSDRAILDHVRGLARIHRSTLVFVHVADGWAARNIRQLDLQESEEMRADREYIETVASGFEQDGFDADAVLACGDPATEISDLAQREQCDLIAMATHGHRFLKDILFGSVANEVRHMSLIPVLLVRARPEPKHA